MKAPKLPKGSPRRQARKALDKTAEGIAKIPGPSPNPATNLLIADVAMRGLSLLIESGLQRVVLRTKYDREKAAAIVKGRTMGQTIVATGVAQVASRSVPGFLAISGGLLGKTLLDRSKGRRAAKRAGEKTLTKQAKKADDTL